jgi:hypothetical protein
LEGGGVIDTSLPQAGVIADLLEAAQGLAQDEAGEQHLANLTRHLWSLRDQMPTTLRCHGVNRNGALCQDTVVESYPVPLCELHAGKAKKGYLSYLRRWLRNQSAPKPGTYWHTPDNEPSLAELDDIYDAIGEYLVARGSRVTRLRKPRPASARPKRAGLSARTRFAVLERDGFCCHYCGRAAPDVVLHVDHIVAKANGGTDDEDNLIAACVDCNLGKATKELFS